MLLKMQWNCSGEMIKVKNWRAFPLTCKGLKSSNNVLQNLLYFCCGSGLQHDTSSSRVASRDCANSTMLLQGLATSERLTRPLRKGVLTCKRRSCYERAADQAAPQGGIQGSIRIWLHLWMKELCETHATHINDDIIRTRYMWPRSNLGVLSLPWNAILSKVKCKNLHVLNTCLHVSNTCIKCMYQIHV